jgi:prepilin-type processing-associated H-X9-DG protein
LSSLWRPRCCTTARWDRRRRFQSYLQARHNGLAGANFVDGHARTVKGRVREGANSTAPTWDGKQARIFDVGEVGPYQNQFNLWGVAARRANGTPCRNCPNRNDQGNCGQ